MCGIAGLIYKNSSREFDERLLRQMADVIAHRGPDDEGYYVDAENGIGLANRRLSIIDLPGGKQPMPNDDESIWITYNGEIYNFPELRNEAELKGHRFKSRSDTEVILRAYEEYGPDAFAKLNGIFGLAIYDKRKASVFLARDQYGVKPVYYFENAEKVLFGSEIKSILCDPSIEQKVDPDALSEFITLRYNPSPSTLFASVKKLTPGHYIEITRRGCSDPKSYLSKKYPSISKIGEQEAIEEYRRLLAAAVKRQMISDVPLGLFLSGGVDSAAIGKLMSDASDGPIRTFTIGFPGKGDHNELADARDTADYLNSRHSEITIDHEDYIKFFARSFEVIEEPIAETSVSALYYLSKRAAADVKVVLAGQGADEPMGGYHRYLGVSYIEKYRPLIRAAAPLARLLHRNERVKHAGFVAGQSAAIDRLLAAYSIFTPAQRQELFKNSVANGSRVPARLHELFEESHQLPDVLSKIMYIDTRMSLADDLLLFNDKVTMANSLEMRVPFLDLELVAFLETLPADLKVRGSIGKYIHKRAVDGWLPHEIVHRRKRGFQTPMDKWLQKDLADGAKLLFEEKDSACRRYFDLAFIERLIDAHRRRKENHQKRLYALLCFELWHRSWIDRKPVDAAVLLLTGNK